MCLTGLCHFLILSYLLSSLSLSMDGSPTQAESILLSLGEPTVKRERTTTNVKSRYGIGLVFNVSVITNNKPENPFQNHDVAKKHK